MAQLNTDLETIKTARDNMKIALEGQGQTVTKDIRTYAQAIANISGGSGDVKLFETVEEMQEDPNPQEGDLAVVYREEIQPVTEESEFDSCIFPNTVVLDEAVTGNVSERFRQVDDGYFDGIMHVSSTVSIFQGYGESSEIRVQYTSQDGITYTRTDGGVEFVEFGTTIKWQSMGGPFHSIIGNFMKIGGNYFDGLYECKSVDSDTDFLGYTNFVGIENNCTYDTENVPVSVIEQAYGLIPESDLSKLSNGFIVEYIDNNNLNFYYSGYTYSSQQYMACPKLFTPYNYTQDSKLYIATKAALVSNGFIKKMIIDIENESVTEESVPSTDVNNRNSQWVSNNSINTNNKWLAYKDSHAYELEVNFRNSDGSVTGNGITIKAAYPKVDKYVIASTQLDITRDYVYEKIFYGKNGIETGALQAGVVYNDTIKNIYINIANMFTDTGLVIKDGIELSNLPYTELPFKIDTSTMTDMYNMFHHCTNLTTIPLIDTSNVTNMTSMFYSCNKLSSIPLLDTGNVIDMTSMFYSCSNLETVPLLNTTNVKSFYGMFHSCNNLTTVPQFDTSSIISFEYMFYKCPSLSNESLNNILIMCANATGVTSNKTLAKIGLSQEQAQICTTLSNYQAFVNAGWTTGY